MAGSNNTNSNPSGKSMRGFASMDPVRQRQIASEGGRASRSNATSHRSTSQNQAQQAPAARPGNGTDRNN